MKISLLVCALLLLSTLLLPKDTNRKADMFRIPTTAVKMAEAVLTPVYGEQQVLSERPYIATLKEGVWSWTARCMALAPQQTVTFIALKEPRFLKRMDAFSPWGTENNFQEFGHGLAILRSALTLDL
jgi:hypothetical protein